MKKRPLCFVGIDVSNEHLALACRPEPTRWRVANDSAGIAQGIAPLRQRKPALIGLDATGGWPDPVVAALALAKLPFAGVNPRPVRDVAKATGHLAESDARDAGVIAHFAEAVRPTPRPLPDATTPPRDALLQRRRHLLELLVAERHRVARAHPTVRERRARHREYLQRLITATDEEGATIIRTSPAWRAEDDLLQSAPGRGAGLAATLPAALPKLGVLNRREVATFVGGAPLNDESGKRAGARHIRGGRAGVRGALYMATPTATRRTPIIQAFSQRVLARGKAQKVAITAAMRKPLTILNAMVKPQTHGNARVNHGLVPA